MKRFLKLGRVAAVAGVFMIAAGAAGMAADPVLISGAAANRLLTSYEELAARSALPALNATDRSFTVQIEETPQSFSVEFRDPSLPSGRMTSSALRSTTAERNAASDRNFSSLLAGTKSLDALSSRAVLSVLAFAHQHPARVESVRQDDSAGNYTLRVTGVGRFVYVGMSYPGSAALGHTAIGCNPQREFRYEPTLQAIEEVRNPCS